MNKWEREITARKMAEGRRMDLKHARELEKRDMEIQRQRTFLRLIVEPLNMDLLASGDFREIAKELTTKIGLAGMALRGESPSAPKDGKRVLVAEAGFWMAVARYVPAHSAWIETEASGMQLNPPTHWMPLPAPPAASLIAKGEGK